MRARVRTISVAVAMCIAGPALAADYYVAPNGNDSDKGTSNAPWKTLDKANRTLRAGDTVFIRAGTYREQISPANSGSSGKPIVYRAYPGETVHVRGSSNANAIVDLQYDQYIVIDGLNIRFGSVPPKGTNTPNILLKGGGNHVIRNVKVVNWGDYIAEGNSGHRETGIFVTSGSKYNLIEDSTVRGMSLHAISVGGGSRYTKIINNDLTKNYSNSVMVGASSGEIQGTLIESNILGESYTSDGVQTNPDFSKTGDAFWNDTSSRGVVVRNNVIRNNGENGVDLKGAAYWVVEGNVIQGGAGNNYGPSDGGDRDGGAAITKGGKTSSMNVIIRKNLIVDNGWGGTQAHEGWKIYNNTIVNNTRDYTGPNSSYRWDRKPLFMGWLSYNRPGVSIINNIVGDNLYELVQGFGASNNDIDHNLYFSTWKQPGFVQYNGDYDWRELGFDEWRKWSGKDRNSTVALPEFRNVPSRPTGDVSRFDFNLSANSPAVDSGRPLTAAVGSGSGAKAIKVKDARFFFDGYGVTDGDLVQIGKSRPVEIVRIDYGANTLYLKDTVSWKDGDAVSLPYFGAAPDRGAFEYSEGHAPITPKGLRLRTM